MATEAALDLSTPGLSEPERLVDTFLAPSKTFNDIRRNASWWAPFLLLLLFSAGLGYTVQKQVGFERAFTNNLHDSPMREDQINNLPTAQKAASIAGGAKSAAVFTYGFPVALALGFLLYSLLLWAIFKFGLGASTTFGQVYAVSWYAALPYLLTTLLTIVTLWFGGNAESYDYANPVGTNLAYFLPDASPAVKALLGALDIVKLWSLALQVIGMAIIAKKSIAQSAVVVVGWFVFVVAIATGIAAAFS
jgi:hypothetical protein